MEGLDQYERSYKELKRVLATLSNDNVTVDFAKLDGDSKRILRDSIKNTITPRLHQINNMITGAN